MSFFQEDIDEYSRDAYYGIVFKSYFHEIMLDFFDFESNGRNVVKQEWKDATAIFLDFDNFDYNPTMSRLQLACYIFLILHKEDVDDFQRHFTIFYNSISEPIMPAREFRKILLPAFIDEYREEFRNTCIQYDFLQVIQSSNRDKTPRSLMHLARHSIRNSLTYVTPVDAEVSTLNVPLCLMDYITDLSR